MTIPPKLMEIIYLDQRLQWEFSCAYKTSYEITNDMTVNSASIQDNFSSSGAFDVSLREGLQFYCFVNKNLFQKFEIAKTSKASMKLTNS